MTVRQQLRKTEDIQNRWLPLRHAKTRVCEYTYTQIKIHVKKEKKIKKKQGMNRENKVEENVSEELPCMLS